MDNNTPAFPVAAAFRDETIYEAGMSKRFYAATAIIASMASHGIMNREQCVTQAYNIADELLKQENK